jgi:flagellar hook-basal body complex protein FliE
MDPVQLKPFDFAAAVQRAGLSLPAAQAGKAEAGKVLGGNFQDAMADALKAVSGQQNETRRLQREVQLDNPTVSLEETMVAMQKSQIGFQTVLQVRNRLVSAYSEIMNMQI